MVQRVFWSKGVNLQCYQCTYQVDDPMVPYVKFIINVILDTLSVSIHMLSSSIGLVFGKRIFMDRVESILS